MNKKDYKEIAKIIKKNTEDTEFGLLIHPNLRNELADYFESDMMSFVLKHGYGEVFDRKQFLKDCGVEKEIEDITPEEKIFNELNNRMKRNHVITIFITPSKTYSYREEAKRT